MNILVYAEQRHGILKKAAKEALSLAAKLSGNQPASVSACIIGSGTTNLAAELKGYGADTVYVADSAEFKDYNVYSYAAALAAAVESSAAEIVIGVASPMGKDLFPRLAARLEAGLVTDAVAVTLDGSTLMATKPLYAGKCLADLAISQGKVKLVTVRPNVFAAQQNGQGAAAVKPLNVSSASSANLVTKEIRKGKTEKVDLTEASIIITGGRSLGSLEKFKILFDCADAIGASVGASRAAVDAGYATHDMQVGQTGKTVNPNLYIACGVSGSIQHMAGMRTSKVIVAVNTDAEAPIFNIADYGIVADLFDVVPLLQTKMRASD